MRTPARLRDEGFAGSCTAVKDAVRDLTKQNQKVFVVVVPRPGEAQVDFGQALAKVNGPLRKVGLFVMALQRECTETFLEGTCGRSNFSAGCPGVSRWIQCPRTESIFSGRGPVPEKVSLRTVRQLMGFRRFTAELAAGVQGGSAP